MKKVTVEEAVATIATSSKITFLTGAGVSTPSGIPDYRSLRNLSWIGTTRRPSKS